MTLTNYEFKDEKRKERNWELFFFLFDESVEVVAARRREMVRELIYGRV